LLKPKAPKVKELNPPEATPAGPAATPRIIPRSEHAISRSHISANALRVLYRLHEAGFQAFLVGGCVRDLLLGLEPKDFDVATDALPEQVKRLFRNSRLVGRRFRLAHVFFGREIIEVATFRATSAPLQGEEPLADADPEDGEAPELDDAEIDTESLEEPDAPPEAADAPPARIAHTGAREASANDDFDDRHVDVHGRILRDNVYGTIEEDVWRRDFTANALYYNIADFSIWDYVDGARDIQSRTLRLIGDPETRFREDPVRLLRAARFEAKLGFHLDSATGKQIKPLRDLLASVPPARLFDETLKLFLTGHGAKSFEVLRRRGLLAALLPTVDAYFESHPDSVVEKLLVQGLVNTDARVVADKPVTPTFLFALLLYGPIAQHIEAAPPARWHELATILDACDRATREAQTRIAIPKRFALGVREMFALQPRLEHPRGRRALRVLEHPRFRAAYDLLLLRAQYGLAPEAMAKWWTELQEASVEERGRMADAMGKEGGTQGPPRSRRRRRPRRRRPGPPAHS
jgi:poly(A) polymerase